jgi:hypothetical protein
MASCTGGYQVCAQSSECLSGTCMTFPGFGGFCTMARDGGNQFDGNFQRDSGGTTNDSGGSSSSGGSSDAASTSDGPTE